MTKTQVSSLLPRKYDTNGLLQMAEAPLDVHSAAGTPLDELFIVHHYDLPTPSDAEQLEIVAPDGGCHVWSIEQLHRLGSRDVVAVLECAGNARGLRVARTPGTQFGVGMFGQARWAGVPLAALLGASHLTDSWSSAVLYGRDSGVAMPEGVRSTFAKGLPREKALRPDTLLAWEVDGAPLPRAHGGPIRLVVPGWYGIWWVKWVARIELVDQEFQGFWQKERYTYQDEAGRVLNVVTDQLPRAVILSPKDGAHVRSGAVISGVAWAGEQHITQIEITFDDGRKWLPAGLLAPTSSWGWTQWETRLPAELLPGVWRVAARARDDLGRSQDWEAPFNRLGYGNNAIHRIAVDLVPEKPVL